MKKINILLECPKEKKKLTPQHKNMNDKFYPKCKTCRHWGVQPPNGSWRNTSGICGRIYDEGESIAHTFNHWGDDSGLKVSPDFGCLLHESNKKLTPQHKNTMKRTLGYALLILVGIAILAPLAYALPLTTFFGAVGSTLLLTLAVIKGIEWTL